MVSSFLDDDADSDGTPRPEDDDGNYCFRPQDFGTQTRVSGGLFACEDPVKDDGDAVAAANDIQFATITGATNPTANADTNLVLLEGTTPVFSVAFANMVVDDAAPTVTLTGDQIGAVSQAVTNPFAGWTYGIFDGNRAQALYFE